MTLFIQEAFPPFPPEVDFLGKGIYEEALAKKGMRPPQKFGFLLRDKDNQTVGGIEGFCYYGCLHIDQLYIQKSHRGQGWGKKLIETAETFGLKNECALFTVNTMDWEARNFYENLGYSIEFCRSGYENNSSMYFMKKTA